MLRMILSVYLLSYHHFKEQFTDNVTNNSYSTSYFNVTAIVEKAVSIVAVILRKCGDIYAYDLDKYMHTAMGKFDTSDLMILTK